MREEARRSLLLTGLSYPLFIAGIILLFTAITVPGAVLLGSGVFLIGINELCVYIARTGPVPRGMDR
ncbi:MULTISPECIES: hypothetical protein [unclassified Brevibacterium]|uniref:hypothetical protein n=1 Tax=unclassified Brevibacterium TaxID=2614124 RepID=UPI000C683C1B|nr:MULTISPECIES: hypothetical protein [unclassified Brevibacterium]SMX97474.1 hypothetical protein BSP239C_02824 [Brevibacterium sp. 239c]